MKLVVLIIPLTFPWIALATEKADQFQALEKRVEPKAAIAILLKPYGKVEDFKIFDESLTSEHCLDKTVLRAKVTCNQKQQTSEMLYFAEGNGMLCRISNNLSTIKCLPK